jgi:glycosyltransferase involved in cell wall biosynthesis
MGLGIPNTDWIMLKLYGLLLNLSLYKLGKYSVFHNLSRPRITKSKIQIIHIDDPTYTEKELSLLRVWERKIVKKKKTSIIVCTNDFTKNWLINNLIFTRVIKIEQGFIDIENQSAKGKNFKKFSCVYSSPYICIGDDKHAGHETWDASHLINDLIPTIVNMDESIYIHLIGNIGKDASAAIKDYPNVICHGLVGINENMKILSMCTIALYPRRENLQRSLAKIYNYIGASLPVVTYDLPDTKFIKKNKLGMAVKNPVDFVQAIMLLKNDVTKRLEIKNNIQEFKTDYSWQRLSGNMEKYLLKTLSKLP